jgi:Leucine-rich repeat (LRR) protein
VNPSGEFSLNVVTHLEKEFRTFLIKLDPKVLITFGTEFSSSTLDYLDVTGRIKQTSGTGILAYLFDEITSIPSTMLDLMKLSRELLEGKLKPFIAAFKEFRQEKNIIKTIKYKAEIIKTSKEEWTVLDRVCRTLVEGKGLDRDGLKYNKYRHLDLSNLKQITAVRAGLLSLSRWVKSCHSLKILDLNWNNITRISKEQLPPYLTRLSLNYNRLQSMDISGVSTLAQLELNRN